MKLRQLAAAAALVVGAAAPAAAQSPIQLSLWNPAQMVKEGEAVEGLRLNLIYTKNTNTGFIDLGFGFNHTTGNGSGVQWAAVTRTEGNFTGWQAGLVGVVEKSFTGLQSSSWVNSSGTGEGVQFGLVNVSKSFHGLQLGIVNVADKMNNGGLQIGLINIIKTGGVQPFLPIVNWSF
jgi:hypothetical protein